MTGNVMAYRLSNELTETYSSFLSECVEMSLEAESEIVLRVCSCCVICWMDKLPNTGASRRNHLRSAVPERNSWGIDDINFYSSWVHDSISCRSEEHTSELQSLRHLV